MNLKTIFVLVLVVLCTSNLVNFYLHSRASSQDECQTSNFSSKSNNSQDFSSKTGSPVDNLQDQAISTSIIREYLKSKKPFQHDSNDDIQTRPKHTEIYKKFGLNNNNNNKEVSGSFVEKEPEEPKIEVNTTQPLNNSRQISLQRVLELNPFKKLGLYQTMPMKYYNAGPGSRLFRVTRYYGINKDDHYCEKVDMYNLLHPKNVFEKIKFVTDYAADESLVRRFVMPRFGQDVLPKLRFSMPVSNYKKSLFNLPMNTTMYFFKRVMVHHYYEVNKQMMCNSQMYNHIPGHGVLTRKDLVVDSIKEYAKKYENKPTCFKENVYFPLAYRLNNYWECKQFFQEIETKEFQERKLVDPIQYIIKVGFGAHRAAGLSLFDETQEALLKERYAGGAMCGRNRKSLVAQKYISNPLLLDKKNKFDFRIYMLVASVDPLIVYYHDGFLRVSLSTYDKFSKTKNVHFTNTHLSKKIFSKAKQDHEYQGMNENELRDYQMWMMEDLQNYLLKIGKIKDNTWLDTHLRPKFQEAYIHLARMAEKSFYKSPAVFELYGLDFVIDENLDIWFIECNASPQLVGTNARKSKFLYSMLSDMFDIQQAYFRSRMKRVFAFVKNLQERAKADPNLDYDELRKEFNSINTNKLDPEFPINPNNSFTLIMDKNIQGPGAYFGHLKEECVDLD